MFGKIALDAGHKNASRIPNRNAYVERLNGSIRRECTDHIIVWNDRQSIIVGAQNVLNEFPDKEPRELTLGYKYPEGSPMSFNGGFYYPRIRVDMQKK